MQEPTMYSGVSFAGQQQVKGSLVHRLAPLILSVLVVALAAGGLFWLQWASQRSIALGYPMPQIHMTSSPSNSILINNNAQFSASASGRGITYSWDFGDGSTASDANVSHTYQSNGTFTATVRVTDAIGQTSSDTTSVRVVPPAPSALFTYSLSYYGGYIYFYATGSTADSSTSIANYSWDFGDGNSDPHGSVQETHSYSSTGTYQVTLIVTDGTGQDSAPYRATVVIS